MQRLEGGRQFRVVRYEPTDAGVDHALLDREVTAVLHIPRRFEEDLVRRGVAPVQLVLNAEEGATAGIVQSYAQLDPRRLRAGARPDAPDGRTATRTARVAPLDLRTQRWFNPTRSYKHWMVPALMVSLTTIIGLLLTAQNITRENELGTLEQLNVTPMTKIQFIAAKLIPFWILSLVIFTIGLIIGKLVFGIPMRGNLLLVYLAATVYLVVVLGLGPLDLHHHPDPAAGDVRGVLRDPHLPADERAVHAGGLDAGLGTEGGRGEPGEALRGVMRAVLVRGAGLETVGRPILGLAWRASACWRWRWALPEVGGLGLSNCHPERSEGSWRLAKIPGFARDDSLARIAPTDIIYHY